jgi:hypothetical protein
MSKEYVVITLDEFLNCCDTPSAHIKDTLASSSGEEIVVFSTPDGSNFIDTFFYEDDDALTLYAALQNALPILVWAASSHVTGALEALEEARAAFASAGEEADDE